MYKRYILKIRLGEEYIPVDFYSGKIYYENYKSYLDRISLSALDIKLVEAEMYEYGHKSGDFVFEEIVNE